MTTKADYTPEEWQAIMQSPMAAAMVVMLASPSGPIGLVQETFAATKMLAENLKTPSGNALINAVAAEIQDAEGRKAAQPPKLEGGADLVAYKTQAVGTLQQVSQLLATKAPDEAAGFKSWLVETARNVASAAKEGGFLGIGGTQVTPEEEAAVREVSATLGVA